MTSVEIFVVLFLLTIGSAAFALRFNILVEIILLLASLLISLIPGLPIISFEPHIVFTLFLPPILFAAAAYATSWRDFIRNIRPIALLAVGLVIFTTCGVALAIKWLIPGLSWPLSFLLGAIVSPPDASAATAIAKKLGIPRRLITILEGESLINDATALTTYSFALAAIATGSFSFWQASTKFVTVSVMGVILGYGISRLGSVIYLKLTDSRARNMLTLAMPFVAYLLAERLGASGVISTVTAGLAFARRSPELDDADTRYKGEAIWEMLIFIINGLVFTLIGFQLPTVVKGLEQFSVAELALYASVCSLVVIGIRFAWIFPTAYLPRLLNHKLRHRYPMPAWNHLVLLSWVGMRGIVSLAAALAIPEFAPNGDPFPYRNLFIFLTYCVILSTLLIPTFTLPKIMALFKIKSDGLHQKEIVTARLAATESVLMQLDYGLAQKNYPATLLQQVKQRYKRRLLNLQGNLQEMPYSALFVEEQTLRSLNNDLIKIERQVILRLRKQGKIHDEVFYTLQRELDLEKLRLKTQRF